MRGGVTNGLLDARWNLVKEDGTAFTNGNFNSFYTITLPDGRSQILKQDQNKIGGGPPEQAAK